MLLKAGMRMRSATSAAEVIVIRCGDDDTDLRSGGVPMVPVDQEVIAQEPVSGFDEELLIGKRYGSDESGIELLCAKAGLGTLSIGKELLPRKEAKPLPSSD
ncbi:MAG: Uncharacterized protein JWM55_1835 [Acidimicrobiaceae bacterium]|nr:Uncharacterized protein [Acidimicrobiaceae bacterium]